MHAAHSLLALKRDVKVLGCQLKSHLLASIGKYELLEDEIQTLRSENKILGDLCDQMSIRKINNYAHECIAIELQSQLFDSIAKCEMLKNEILALRTENKKLSDICCDQKSIKKMENYDQGGHYSKVSMDDEKQTLEDLCNALSLLSLKSL